MRLIKRAVAADLTLKTKNISILRKVPRMHMIKKRTLVFVQRPRKIVKAAKLTKQHKVNNGGMLYGFILFSPAKPGPLGQFRNTRLCLGVLCLKSQIPSTPPKKRRASKLQINLKSLYSIVRPRGSRQVTKSSRPRHCLIFDICDLEFNLPDTEFNICAKNCLML